MARAIQAGLVTGEMQPGTIYSVPTLADRFKVSATPVREALLHLAEEGYLEPVRNRGFRVTAVSEKDLDDIYQVRLMLEVPGVGRVAALENRADVEALRPLAASIEAAAEAGDLIAYLDVDTRFHLEMLAMLGNDRLVELVSRLRGQARLLGLRALADSGQLIATALEHRELLTLVKAGDVAGSEALMCRHIAHTRGVWAQPAPR